MLLTVGHSTHSAEKFLELLRAHQVRLVVDVRTVPRSRRNPQFNREILGATLRDAGVDYRHMPALGGLRHPRKDSVNTAWQNDNFRGYADYMQTVEFQDNLQELIGLAKGDATAVMCAEAVPWRCHRSLIADALLARGIEVQHILSVTARRPHAFTSFARIEGTRVTYPGLPFPQ